MNLVCCSAGNKKLNVIYNVLSNVPKLVFVMLRYYLGLFVGFFVERTFHFSGVCFRYSRQKHSCNLTDVDILSQYTRYTDIPLDLRMFLHYLLWCLNLITTLFLAMQAINQNKLHKHCL